jgi:trk system potassium uptake protein TrkH
MTWLLTISPVLGIIAMAMSATHLLPIVVSLVFEDGVAGHFALSMVFNFAVGCLLWILTRRYKR